MSLVPIIIVASILTGDLTMSQLGRASPSKRSNLLHVNQKKKKKPKKKKKGIVYSTDLLYM